MVSVNQYWENEVRKGTARNPINIEYATVIELTRNGSPIIQFDGEGNPSAKIYPALDSYMPKIGQRIVLLNNIIIGGIKIGS